MTRAELEHLIRAAADIADDEDIVVIGSQAILGQFPDAPESMRVSAEADLYPLKVENRSGVSGWILGPHNFQGMDSCGVSSPSQNSGIGNGYWSAGSDQYSVPNSRFLSEGRLAPASAGTAHAATTRTEAAQAGQRGACLD